MFKTEIRDQYQIFGRYWLPVPNHSRTDVFIFGATETTGEYYDYRINVTAADSASGAGERDPQ